MKGVPISPDDIQPPEIGVFIPPNVFDAINELLTKKYSGDRAKIYQNTLISFIREKVGKFEWAWLSFEEPYRQAGWKVIFHDSTHCDTNAFYVFKKK